MNTTVTIKRTLAPHLDISVGDLIGVNGREFVCMEARYAETSAHVIAYDARQEEQKTADTFLLLFVQQSKDGQYRLADIRKCAEPTSMCDVSATPAAFAAVRYKEPEEDEAIYNSGDLAALVSAGERVKPQDNLEEETLYDPKDLLNGGEVMVWAHEDADGVTSSESYRIYRAWRDGGGIIVSATRTDDKGRFPKAYTLTFAPADGGLYRFAEVHRSTAEEMAA